MVNVRGVPGQPLAEGVTVMVAVTGVVPVFTPLKTGRFPVPEAAKPMAGLLLVHAKVLPVTGPVKFTAVEGEPLHTVWLVTGSTVGCWVYRNGKRSGRTGHPEAIGVTVTVAVMGADVALVALERCDVSVASKPPSRWRDCCWSNCIRYPLPRRQNLRPWWVNPHIPFGCLWHLRWAWGLP